MFISLRGSLCQGSVGVNNAQASLGNPVSKNQQGKHFLGADSAACCLSLWVCCESVASTRLDLPSAAAVTALLLVCRESEEHSLQWFVF